MNAISRAARWSAEPDPFGAGTGLHDGVQVAIEPGFVANLGGADVAALYGVSESVLTERARQSILAGIRQWENDVLNFEIRLDGPAVEGLGAGLEIDLFARPHFGTQFGFAVVDFRPAESRLLTNGQRLPGDVIIGADIFINSRRIEEGAQLLFAFGLPLEFLLNALQILVAHEVGHALGLGHPNQGTFYDTDTDPFNEMTFDPYNPFGSLIVSSIPASPPPLLLPIMWGGISGGLPQDLLPLLVRVQDPAFAPDDRGGRDVLYPLPPPPLPPTSIEVMKTASSDGRFVSGTISITNAGENPAAIWRIEDTLEVHFPKVGKSAPPSLPGGSTRNWFEVAHVPVASPGIIEVAETVEIDYSFDLCLAEDFQGANAMRNAVAVTLFNKPVKARKDTVTTRSEGFEPPVLECPAGPVTEDLSPCFAADRWEFDVEAGQTVFIEADTVDATTAADLCFFGICPSAFISGDDDFACTFPPPAFSCPRDFVVVGSGTCTVEVTTCSSTCFDSSRANYSLSVERDGELIEPTLVGDDL